MPDIIHASEKNSQNQALSQNAAVQLIHAFVTSKLDSCNALLTGLPHSTIYRLQLVQNAAARLLTRCKRSHHISPILNKVHWLPIKYKIQFKILLLTFKALHGLAPFVSERHAATPLYQVGSEVYQQ